MKLEESWKTTLRTLDFGDPARYAIVESWSRSRQAQLERKQTPGFRRVSAVELEQRLQAAAELVEIAVPRLWRLLRELPRETDVGYLTDHDGVVLASVGAPDQI